MGGNQGAVDVNDQRVLRILVDVRRMRAGELPRSGSSYGPSRADLGQTLVVGVGVEELDGPGDRRLRRHMPV